MGLSFTYAESRDLLLESVKSDLQPEPSHDTTFTPLSCAENISGASSCTEADSWYDHSSSGRSVWNQIFSNDRLYSAYTAWEIKPGNERVLGDGQIMVPLWQTTDSLLFADLRGQMDDQQSYEGNWGLGFRQIRNDSWILGVYGYYDLRHTEYGNNFNQGTFGLEVLSVEWEARVNGYIPETGTKAVSSLNSAGISNGIIVVRAGEERAYHGVDAEIGKLLNDWCDGDVELRGYLGGYHFDTNAGGYPHISGPRGRVELRAYDLNWLGEGSRVTIGGELQWDEVRDTQAFAMLRVRIPLGPESHARQMTRLERRMLDRVVRDVDVIAHAQAGPEETTVNPLTGREFGQVQIVDANGNLQAAVDTAGVNGTVIVSGDAGQLNPANTINLKDGQTLLGGGSSLQVTGASTGTTVTFTAPGSMPVISQASSSKDVINLADNTVVYGNTIDGGLDSLDATGVEGSIVIQNNVIQNSNRHGLNISLSGSQTLSAHVENNQFINVDDDAIVGTVFGDAKLDLSNSIVGNTFLGMNNTNNAVRLQINASSGDTAKITASIRDNVITDLNQDGVFLDIDDTGEMVTTITNNQFLRIAGDGVEISVEDHDDGNLSQTTTVTNNQFTDIVGAGVRIETNDNDSDDDYLITQNTTITGNTFLRNGVGVAIQYDSDSDSDGGDYVSTTTISANKFLEGAGDGINLDVSDWDDEDLTIDLNISNNEFATHAGNAIDLSVGDIDLDSGVVVFRPVITGNAFTGTAQDNIRINVSDEASLAGSILNNTITGGIDGLDVLSGGDGTNTMTIGGNTISGVTGTGIQFNSDAATTISDSGLNNMVITPGTVFNFDNQGNLGGSQILINSILEP